MMHGPPEAAPRTEVINHREPGRPPGDRPRLGPSSFEQESELFHPFLEISTHDLSPLGAQSRRDGDKPHFCPFSSQRSLFILNSQNLNSPHVDVWSRSAWMSYLFELRGLQHLLVGPLREQSGGLVERLQVVVTVQQQLLVQLLLLRMRMRMRMRKRLRRVQLPHAARAIHGGHAQLHVTVGLEVVVQVLVAASAPPAQPPRLPPLHGHLHLAAQGAQRRVDVQILEGATVAAEDVVEHRRQVEVAPQDVGAVRLRRHQGRLGGPHRLAAVLRRVLPLLADFLVRADILCAVVTLNQFALSVGATATATATAATVVVGRNPPAFEDAVDEHVFPGCAQSAKRAAAGQSLPEVTGLPRHRGIPVAAVSPAGGLDGESEPPLGKPSRFRYRLCWEDGQEGPGPLGRSGSALRMEKFWSQWRLVRLSSRGAQSDPVA
ncbi:hypothetical protein EYF80_043290 [Liparis tanakae]|uniref:Uncharacterized protein n=1 Tax=Liparis tanakae TaxID=230148 RepID=A0A4Z2FYZ2_9TELE|nr:hypothetical protein EYF80_043290 [Liparis tanakae]